jgi:hypothetical protein
VATSNRAVLQTGFRRLVGRLAILLAGAGCAQLVGADFGDPHLRPSSAAAGASSGGEGGAQDPLTILAHLMAPRREQTSAQFGYTLALDAKSLVVTAPYQDIETEAGVKVSGGAAFVFDLQHTAAPAIPLVAPNVDAMDGVVPDSVTADGSAQAELFGSLHVALGDDVVVIGVPGEDSAIRQNQSDNSAPQAGAVYVYDRADLGAAPQYIKAPKPESGAFFGESISVSGSRLAIGAPGEDGVVAGSGAAYVYERHNGRFDDVPARLEPPTAHEDDGFGLAVAIEGDLVVVGAPGTAAPDNSLWKGNGAAHVYRFTNGQWAHEQSVTPAVSKQTSLFGVSLSLSNGRFAVGTPQGSTCPGDDANLQGPLRGTVYLVGETQGSWAIERCLSPAAGSDDLFGFSVALLADRLVVGAPWDPSGRRDDPRDGSRPFAGAAHLYERNATGDWPESVYIKARDIQANDVFGGSVAIAPGLVAVGVPQEAGGEHGRDPRHYSGAVYLFSAGSR